MTDLTSSEVMAHPKVVEWHRALDKQSASEDNIEDKQVNGLKPSS